MAQPMGPGCLPAQADTNCVELTAIAPPATAIAPLAPAASTPASGSPGAAPAPADAASAPGFRQLQAIQLGEVLHLHARGKCVADLKAATGKSQMAFWGLLVAVSFLGVWAATGTMERIPPQALVLLGISAATGLGAVVINASKSSSLESDLAQKLAAVKPPPAGATQQQQDAVGEEIKNLKMQLDAARKPPPPVSHGFWRDICDDGNGMSFHRLQVVLWTLILGVIFVRSVTQVMTMPEFSDTLLLLMGISSGTYLGFKFPEKA